MDEQPTIRVFQTLRHLSFLTSLTKTTIIDIQLTEGAGVEFTTFENEIRDFHGGIIAVLSAVNIDPANLAIEGLRVSEESWQNPPAMAIDALEEVREIYHAMMLAMLQHEPDLVLPVPGYYQIFHDRFSSVYDRIGQIFDFSSELTQHTSVVDALRHLSFLVNSTHTVILDLQITTGAGTEFTRFEPEIRILHRALIALVSAVNLDPVDLVSEGLRISEESWANPPASGIVALLEVQRILDIVNGVLHHFGGFDDVPVPGYLALVHDEFPRVFNHVTNVLYWLTENIAFVSIDDDNEEVDPMADAQGASEEDIENMDLYIAGSDEDHECSICIGHIVVGEEMKILPCNHAYHADCIDGWLRNSSTCPIDRRNPFTE